MSQNSSGVSARLGDFAERVIASIAEAKQARPFFPRLERRMRQRRGSLFHCHAAGGIFWSAHSRLCVDVLKIYATDIDDEELSAARRGEYSEEAVRKVRPEWRDKYFRGKDLLRVNRDIRQLVIFGKSNLAQDAPISMWTFWSVAIY